MLEQRDMMTAMKKKVNLLIAFGLGLLAFTVYHNTLCPGVYPGASATAMGKALGVLPVACTGNPVWLAVSRAAVHLPVGNMPYFLNLVNAYFGGLAVCLCYLVSKKLFCELMRPEPDLHAAFGTGAAESPLREREGAVQRSIAAELGATVTALTFAFCAPFWRAATSLTEHPMEILLLLSLAGVLLRCRVSAGRDMCVAAMFLTGLGVVESPVFLILTPVVAAVLIRGVVRSDTCSEQVLPLLLLAGLAGFAANMGLGLYLASSASGAESEGLTKSAQSFAQVYRGTLVEGLHPEGWFFIWAVPAFSFVMSVICLRSVVLRDEGLGLPGWSLLVILTGIMVAHLLNLPYTAWAAARQGEHLPVFPPLMIALAAGCVFICWLKAAVVTRYGGICDLDSPPRYLRKMAGLAMCGLMVITVLRQPCSTLDDADGRRAAFADGVAQELREVCTADSLVPSAGAVGLNLRIWARAAGQTELSRQEETTAADGGCARGKVSVARLNGCADRCERLLRDDPAMVPALRRSIAEMRQQTGCALREVGKICAASGRQEEAAAACRLAARFFAEESEDQKAWEKRRTPPDSCPDGLKTAAVPAENDAQRRNRGKF